MRAQCPAPSAPASNDAESRPLATEAARGLVAEGDLSWLSGDRRAADCAWRAAAKSDDLASIAMAELRRLRTHGNIGLAIHGPRADRALYACPVDDPWCRLARVDRDLLLTELGMGDRRATAAARATELAPLLPTAAAVRSLWATGSLPAEPLPSPSSDRPAGDAAWGPVLTALQAQGGRMPAGPGTWLLGLGVVGASGLGLGPLVRFSHPDLAWRGWRLDAEAWLTSAGAARGRVGLRTQGRTWWTAGASAGLSPLRIYDAQGALLSDQLVADWQVRLAPGLHLHSGLSAWLGPVARMDRPPGASQSWQPGHGLFGGVGLARGRSSAVLSAESALLGPDYLELSATLGTESAWMGGTSALHIVASATPLASSPIWRQPSWGGGLVLRSAPLGRLREPLMAALVPELRHPLVGPLGVAIFGEGVFTNDGGASTHTVATPSLGIHGGAGGGLRLHLPPQPLNTVRMDIAASDLGWAITAGFGEAL